MYNLMELPKHSQAHEQSSVCIGCPENIRKTNVLVFVDLLFVTTDQTAVKSLKLIKVNSFLQRSAQIIAISTVISKLTSCFYGFTTGQNVACSINCLNMP